MKKEDCLIPYFSVGDFVEFNRSKQEDDLFKDEGLQQDQISEINMIYSKEGPVIRYFFEEADDWCGESYILRKVEWIPTKPKPTLKKGELIFQTGRNSIKMKPNGDFIINGKRVTNDMEIYKKFKEMF